MTAIVAASGVVGSAVWIGFCCHLIRHHRRALFLADLPLPLVDLSPPGPGVALIFAARDEAAGVEAAVGSMLGECRDDPSLRIIAVDDRSTDGTGAILDRLARDDPRIAVVHVTDLPDGWLGKTNALQVGADAALLGAARWLLFTDADVVFQPGTIRRAVAYAEAEVVDHIAVGPEVDMRSVGERIFIALFGLLFSLYTPLGRLSDRRSRAHVGIGAFNLVRGETFRAVGGFRHIALSIDDDMRLGQVLKYAGYPMRFLLGRGAISVRWQVGTWGMIRGVEKNFFAGLKFSGWRVVVVMLGVIVTGIGPVAGLFVGPTWTRGISAFGMIVLMIMLGASGRQSRIGWYYAWLLPASAVLILIALARSVALTLLRGGVRWRDHHYPLAALRNHIRDRDAWLAEVWRSTR